MFNEFWKYFWWAPEDATQIAANFKERARVRLKGLFYDTRRKNKKPKFVLPPPPKSGKSYFTTEVIVKNLKIRVCLGRRQDHREALYTHQDLSVRLLRGIKRKKS